MRAQASRTCHASWFWRRLLPCMALGLAMLAESASASDLAGRRALVLFSYHASFPTSDSSLRGVRAELAPHGVTLDVEYMDAKRFPDADSQRRFRELIAGKLARQPPYDVVVLSDDAALDFALAERDTVFGGSPLVFFAVNDADKAVALDADPGVTGVVEHVSIGDTVQLALRLDPGLEELVAVVDGTESGRADLHALMSQRDRLGAVPLRVLDLDRLSWQEVFDRLAALPPHRAVLRLTAFRDRDGAVLAYAAGMRRMAEHSSAPVYHLRDVGFGSGALGGVVVNFEEQGRRAAALARRMLAGEPVSALPVVRASPNLVMVDFPVMRRFGFPLERLPSDAIVLKQPFSVWREYARQLGAAAIAFLLLVAALVLLLLQQAARRRAERRLAESEQRFRNMVEGTVYGVLVHCNRRPVFANEAYAAMCGYDDAAELLALDSIDALYASHEVARMRGYYEARLAGRAAPSEYEVDCLRKDGGVVRVLMAVHTSHWDGEFAVQHNAIDVSERKRAEQLLRDSESRYRALVEHAPEAIVLYDVDARRFVDANHNACHLFGLDRETLLSRGLLDVSPPRQETGCDSDTLLASSIEGVLAGEHPAFEWTFRHSGGRVVPTEVRLLRLPAAGRRLLRGSITDLSEWRQAQRALTQKSAQMDAILENVHQGISMVDEQLRVVAFNERWLALNGIPQGRFERGQPLADFIRYKAERGEYGDSEVETLVAERIAEASRFSAHRYTRTRPDGTVLEVQGKPLPEGGMVMTYTDITETHRLSERLSHQARHDSLTELPNRREFESRLAALLASARTHGAKHAMCYLDLDQFKVINDTCGHAAGDELLRQLAQRLRRRVRRNDTLARLGGDEFGVLLERCELGAARGMAEALRAVVDDFRFSWGDNVFRVGVSVGLVSVDAASGAAEDVLSRADAACYAAKDQGRNRIHVYDDEDRDLAQRHGEMRWVVQIQAALDEDRFELHFQPIVPLPAAATTGRHCELLLRMRDPNGGSIPPGMFLPAAERYNLISQIDRWVVGHALERLSEPRCALHEFEVCSINLSGQSLADDALLEFVQERLRVSGVPASRICFEITETAAIANLARATRFIGSLSALGCRFALDDFGSGLSSFAYLKSLPVDYLKIDGFFIKDIVDDPIDRAMVRSINEIAHVMGKRTIAEFVENAEILSMLQDIGVDYAQGYGIGRPQPLAPSAAARTAAPRGRVARG